MSAFDVLAHAAAAAPKEDAGYNMDMMANILIIAPPILGIIWSIYEWVFVASIKMTGPGERSIPLSEEGHSIENQLIKMQTIAKHIADGATTFLFQEYLYMVVYVIGFSIIILFAVENGGWAALAFVAGCATSCACGFIGMKIATYANVRTAHEAWKDIEPAFAVALRAGSVMGFILVSLGVAVLYGLIVAFSQKAVLGSQTPEKLFEAIAGYGLGGSSIALFGRVGGGIYTKAADVGADLSGKNDYGMDEDDPRNPACIADNVGDNVGDIAGMGADLFGSFAESSCAALVIASTSKDIGHLWAPMMFPLLISSGGIVVGLITIVSIKMLYPVREISQIEKALKGVLVVSTVLMTPVTIVMAYYFLPPTFNLPFGTVQKPVTSFLITICVLCGLWSGLTIGYVTEYFTSHSYTPVREISQTQVVSAATGIIYGLALGYNSVIVPVICLAVSACVAHQVAGMYGVAMAALGMLSTLTMGLTIDAYGPISDNAGGIAEMSELGEVVRHRTDALDAAGNTTAAIGKGFAIGSAALVALALFGAFTVRAKITKVDILDPWCFTGLLFGAMMPYAFSAMTMKSVGQAASNMVQECLRQFPKILHEGAAPDYTTCIAISTQASLREMIAPGALVIGSPLLFGMAFGKNCTAGLLAGGLVSGVQLAISASNSGGAWDNAKKFIEAGGIEGHGKGSAAHKNAVTGDTVGDPLKDTSGPSLNILVKLSAIISLVFGGMLASSTFSNPDGGPAWMKN